MRAKFYRIQKPIQVRHIYTDSTESMGWGEKQLNKLSAVRDLHVDEQRPPTQALRLDEELLIQADIMRTYIYIYIDVCALVTMIGRIGSN